MYFETFQAALTMDGHGVYVWAAFAITLVVLAALVITPLRRTRQLQRELAGQYRRAAAQTRSFSSNNSAAQSEVNNASGP